MMKISGQIIDWLLEPDNPPVRYLTLINLLKKPATSPEAILAGTTLMDYSVTNEILAHENEFWKDDDREAWKYTGKFWQLIFLGHFMADGRDPRIAKGINQILENRSWIHLDKEQCGTFNLLASLMRLGYGDHPVVREESESLALRIVRDRGINCSVMNYSLLPQCYMALPKLLLLFAEIPSQKRSAKVKSAIELIKQELINNRIHLYVPAIKREWQKVLEKAPKHAELPKGETVKNWISRKKNEFLKTHPSEAKEAKQGWLKFAFPLHYNSDILEVMYALARLDTPMIPAFDDALQVIKNKMKPDGKWIMENSLNGKMRADVEEKGKPSKWITYFASYVLNHFGYD